MKVNTDPKAIDEVLSRGVQELINREHLRARMLSGDRLRIKFGIDPTSPHMHLGHTVPLRKLRQFQDLGHQAVLIIGDATAMIGDPTGRSATRKALSIADIKKNQKTYLRQAGKVLDLKKLEVRHNGDWFHKMPQGEFLGLMSLISVQQVMQREDFRKRVEDPENPLTTLEIIYPPMQGYDSVMVRADVEIGGADQLLNLHMGRRMQRRFEMPEQDVLTVPLIEGTDGEKKMSKSFGNAIILEASAEEMFAQTMTIADGLIVKYYDLLTDFSLDQVKQVEQELERGKNPRDVKAQLAWALVRMYHSTKAADQARVAFDRTFKEHHAPADAPKIKVGSGMIIIDMLVEAGFVSSKSEARRVLGEGGVKIDGEVVYATDAMVKPGQLIQKGKRHFVRLVR